MEVAVEVGFEFVEVGGVSRIETISETGAPPKTTMLCVSSVANTPPFLCT